MAKAKKKSAPKKLTSTTNEASVTVKRVPTVTADDGSYVLLPDEVELVVERLYQSAISLKQGLKALGLSTDLSEKSLDAIKNQIDTCTRCKIWNSVNSLDAENHCEDCAFELMEEDDRHSSNSYDTYDDDDLYYG